MIDAHIHIWPHYRSVKAISWIKKIFPDLDVPDTEDEKGVLDKLKQHKISYFFNYVYPLKPEESISLNEYNYNFSKRVRNAFCFASLHPKNCDKKKIIEKAVIDYGLIGLKFHPFVQRFDILDKCMNEAYEVMNSLKRPISFHTGFDRFYNGRLTYNQIQTILETYPNLVIIICHMLYPEIDKAFFLLREYENVYLDGTNVFSGYVVPKGNETGKLISATKIVIDGEERQGVYFHHFLEELERYSNRIMYGTDYPLAMSTLDKIYNHVDGLNISDRAKYNIKEGTAKAFMLRFKPSFFNPLRNDGS